MAADNAPAQSNARLFGSDPMAAMLRALGMEYIALTPGASFRGLHDSLVNYLGNTKPELLLCIHEEHAVSLAHGWTRVTGKSMAVALHSNVGLMHATMAIFNAWCDRVPILMLGAVGPMDAVHRRPWVDWIHTASDLGALVRGYTKWDNQPASVPAALEAMLRAHQIANTEPRGPVYVCLDATTQEQPVDPAIELPPLDRFRPAGPVDPSRAAVAAAAAILAKAERPLILMGRVSRRRADWDRRVALAERLGACVLTDLKTGATFPTAHALHPYPPGLYVTPEAGVLIREADAILALDWIDLAGTVRQACAGQLPGAKVIHCSLDQFVHNGWSMDYQALPPADVSALASPDRMVELLLEALPGDPPRRPAPRRPAVGESGPEVIEGRLSVQAMARTTTDALADHNPAYIRLPLGWPGDCCRFADPLDYVGFDGGGGIGSGPGMAVGAALALRDAGSDRLPVAVLGDGDYLMGLTALWTAVHYRIPVLILVANNVSFFNDELHQERIARVRGRPIENRSVGLRMSDPPNDLAMLARGQGAEGFGPVRSVAELKSAIAESVRKVRAGAVCVIDVNVAPEYSRAMSSTLLRQIPSAT
ncbi:MAG: thiamine pyrophosphate-binding protein [Alphaproteobacteria bacterium]|nr:thiamine pyrophosphate-binding protein [Alphaproteobacteria bacterium]